MNRVITINLHGKAYQLEEAGYEALQHYLQEAGEKLSDNPDTQEILQDFEQSIAEKCNQFLSFTKTVVTTEEIEKILSQMGPVEGGKKEDDGHSSKKAHHQEQGSPKRLYQIKEGALLAGVCQGLAAYFDVDVTIIRVLAVILTILTHGAFALAYFIMMIVVPVATTSEEKARAHGEPFTAHDFLERARVQYARLGNKAYWREQKRAWRKTMRENKRSWQHHYHHQSTPAWQPPSTPLVIFGMAVIGIFTGLISLLWVAAMISAVTTAAIFGWVWPASIPLWVVILLLAIVYNIILSPMRALKWAMFGGPMNHAGHHGQHSDGWMETVNGLSWLAFLIVIGWLIYSFVPGSHSFFNWLGNIFQQVWNWIIHIFQKS